MAKCLCVMDTCILQFYLTIFKSLKKKKQKTFLKTWSNIILLTCQAGVGVFFIFANTTSLRSFICFKWVKELLPQLYKMYMISEYLARTENVSENLEWYSFYNRLFWVHKMLWLTTKHLFFMALDLIKEKYTS